MDKTNKVIQMPNSYCLPPNLADIQIIEQFIEDCFNDEWTIESLIEADPDYFGKKLESKDFILHQLINQDRVWVEFRKEYILVPVSSKNFPEGLDEVEYASSILDMKGGAIFYGEVNDSMHKEMTCTAYKKGLSVDWIGEDNQTKYIEMLPLLSRIS